MDFFICYNKADKPWADWIGWQLKEANYDRWLPDWEIRPGQNEVTEIQKALDDAEKSDIERRAILILSSNFGDRTTQEIIWTSFFSRDPDGSKGLLIPVVVSQNIHEAGILRTIKPICLTDLSEEEAIRCLLAGISGETGKPPKKPLYPGSKPAYPGELKPQSTMIRPMKRSPDYTLGQLDRTNHRDHFSICIQRNEENQKGQTWGFILSGPRREWPQAIRYKLFYFLTEDFIADKKLVPELKKLGVEKSLAQKTPEQYLWELLAGSINCKPDESTVRTELQKLSACHIFYRELSTEEARNKTFLVGMLAAWSTIKLNAYSPDHFLLLICESDRIEKAKFGWGPFVKRTPQWYQNMEALLRKKNIVETLLPGLHPPNLDDVDNWLKHHVEEESLRDNIRNVLQKEFPKSTEIPLAELKKVLLPVIQNHQT